MRSPGGSCFPLCNLLKNSVTSGVILKVNMSLFGCKLFLSDVLLLYQIFSSEVSWGDVPVLDRRGLA